MKKKVSSIYPFLFEKKESFGVERFRSSILKRLSYCASRLLLYLEQEEHLKEEILNLYYQLPYHEYLDSIPGTSPLQQAMVLAFVGDPVQYDTGRCLKKTCGHRTQRE